LHRSECGNHYFSVECSSCSKDKELHPGLFKTSTVNWVAGCVPCPCSNSYLWNRDQYIIGINRKLEGTCWSLQGNPLVDKGNLSKVDVYCNKHDSTHEASVTNIFEGKSPCKICTQFQRRRTRLSTYIGGIDLLGKKEIFYILRFTGRGVSFIKSGICVPEGDITSSIKLRYLKGDYSDFKYEVLYAEVGDYETIANIEIDSQEHNQHNRFVSYALQGFSGYSECFTEFLYKGVVYK